MSQIIKNEASAVDALQKSYPLVKDLCSRISVGIRHVISESQLGESSSVPAHIQSLHNLLLGIENEPVNILLKISELQGFVRGVKESIEKINTLSEVSERNNSRINRVVNEIQSGSIDLNARRKTGERPESLKSIRQAEEKIKESKDI
jgi:hypothetical protein